MGLVALIPDVQVVSDTEYTGTLTSTAAGKLHARKDNLAGTTAPAVSNDSSEGYEVGSVWIDVTGGNIYTCKSAGVGAASWLTSVQSPGGSDTQIQYNNSGAFGGSANLTYSAAAGLTITAPAIGVVPLNISGANGQTANLFNVTSYGGTVGDKLQVTASGNVGIGGTPKYKLHTILTATGSTTIWEDPIWFLENSTGTVVVFESGNSALQSIEFADLGGSRGKVSYNHATDTLGLRASAAVVAEFTGTTISLIGATTINAASGNPLTVQAASATKFIMLSTGLCGFGTTAPDKQVEINSATGDCLRLTYNDANGSAASYTDFAVSSSGDLTITPSGGDVTVAGAAKISAGSDAYLDSELVTNGDFATDTWTHSAPWAHDAVNLEMDYAGTGGAVTSVAINHGGLGYAVSDVLTLTEGTGDAQLTVATVSAAGAILTVTISNAGTTYLHDAGATVTGGSGSGASIAITGIANGSTLSQSFTVVNGARYQIIFTLKNYSGAGRMTISMGGQSHIIFGNATAYNWGIITSSTAALTFTPSADWVGSVDTVSVKRLYSSGVTAYLANTSGTSGVEMRHGGAALYNVAIGVSALAGNTTGSYNNALGRESLRSNTTGGSNNALGYYSLYANTTGNYNNALGQQSLYSNTTGSYNNALGYLSLYANTTGSYNNALGQQSLRSNTTGSYNNALGYLSLYANTTGSYNNALGYYSLYANTTGTSNNALGRESLYANTTGSYNNALGLQSLRYNTTGGSNNALGYASLYSNTTGSYNNALGWGSLYSNTTGGSNVAIGYRAGYSNVSGEKSVFIGYDAGYNETASNKLYIAHSNTATPLIYGDFGTGTLIFTCAGGMTVAGNLTLSTKDLVTDTTTGTKIATATTQKLAFWNATPIVQPANTVAIDTLLVNTGLRATGGVALFDTKVTTPQLRLNSKSELTIATGAVTVTRSFHTIDTESDGASDDLDTINGGEDGDVLVIRAAHTDRTVVAKDMTGNLQLAGDCTLDDSQDTLTLIYDGDLSKWVELSRSAN